ncbi:hypothetical protein Vsou_15400 [Vulcanisaeta souniana JCM 11219]|uniref:PIN domain-containing protein n=2 Tax=Vulcanisaeta souniana TaxID=164452 RepID=A0ABN6SRJ6_9CREN|nr:hypothetical protein Vsou_15400 [Vulcanisaeta souniana JCM 11219]
MPEPEGRYMRYAFTIAVRAGITTYDSIYIAQALRRRILLTSDKERTNTVKGLGIPIILM